MSLWITNLFQTKQSTRKNIFLFKNLHEFAFSLPEGAAAASINDFINAIKKKKKNKLIVLH